MIENSTGEDQLMVTTKYTMCQCSLHIGSLTPASSLFLFHSNCCFVVSYVKDRPFGYCLCLQPNNQTENIIFRCIYKALICLFVHLSLTLHLRSKSIINFFFFDLFHQNLFKQNVLKFAETMFRIMIPVFF